MSVPEWKKLEKVIAGLRPPVPNDMRPDVAELMVKCWNGDPKLRPTFQAITSQLSHVKL